MPADPTIQALLDGLNGPEAPELSDLSATDARALMAGLVALEGEPVPIDQVEDRTVPGPAGDIAVRVYRRHAEGPTPGILVWFHGGGWVIGDLDSGDATARRLADRSGAVVVSVDYRLAPEAPFPAGPDDCWAALVWVAEHGAELGGDPSRLAVGGDSAGGNLAALVALRARDEGGPELRHQLLVYPATDLTMSHPSITENGQGYLLTTKAMDWFAGHYLPPGVDRAQPGVSPLFAEHAGVAPATVITAELDPLRDEGEAYAAALGAAGVDVDLRRYDGMIHGFFSMALITPVATEALDAAAATVAGALA